MPVVGIIIVASLSNRQASKLVFVSFDFFGWGRAGKSKKTNKLTK
jgi:hypothetical protein